MSANLLRSLPVLAPLVLAACGGGGGGSAPLRADLNGTLTVPTVAPSIQISEADARRDMFEGEVAVWLEPGETAPDLRARGLHLVQAGGPLAVYHAVEAQVMPRLAAGVAVEQSAEWMTCFKAAECRAHPAVRFAQPNYRYQPCIEPNDTYYNLQWHYPQINLPQTWDVTQGSSNVIVAVIDTGIVSAHPEFAGRLIAGYDTISDPTNAGDGDGFDSNPEDVGDGAGGQPSSYHGTHVAGTIGANGNDGAGVAGVDWNCKIMPLRSLGRRGGSSSDIAAAILFAAGLPNSTGQVPPQKADIINMSLGGPGTDSILQQACADAAAADVLLVAAAGNDNSANPNSPAQFSSVVSVGAVDLVGARAPYSNFNSTVDIWAPGGDMTSDLNGDSYPDGVLSCMSDDGGQLFFAFENGTSMASPHVAGVAALVLAANPALSAQQLRSTLISTASAGSGLPNGGVIVDALAAVQSASSGGGGGGPTQPALVATPTAADFGETATTLDVALANRGSGNLTFVSATETPNADWLTGNLIAATGGSGISDDRLELVVDRSGLANGVYATTVTVTFTDGINNFSADIEVRAQVGSSQVSADEIFVLLIDANTFETLYQVQTNSTTAFNFSFAGVTTGDYLLVAGTDRDNDDFLGDEGELFGAWPSFDTRQTVTVDGSSRGGLNFALREQTVITRASTAWPGIRRLR